jgi:hypothetical protein
MGIAFLEIADTFSFFRQPVLADEVQTFKALITIHKVLQEGHPMVVREAQQHTNWIDSLMRGVGGDGIRGMESTWEGCEFSPCSRSGDA